MKFGGCFLQSPAGNSLSQALPLSMHLLQLEFHWEGERVCQVAFDHLSKLSYCPKKRGGWGEREREFQPPKKSTQKWSHNVRIGECFIPEVRKSVFQPQFCNSELALASLSVKWEQITCSTYGEFGNSVASAVPDKPNTRTVSARLVGIY